MSKNDQFKFTAVSEFINGEISRHDASAILGVSERSISRMARKVEAQGVRGILHAGIGKTPMNKINETVKLEIKDLIQTKYFDFNMTHALEKIRQEHKLTVSYPTLRRWCHQWNIVKRRKRRRAKIHKARTRMPCEGLLIQFDGSPHRWNGRDEWCLISAIDDATSEIPYAEFFHSEDTLNCMRVLQKIIEIKGIPHALYVDRAGWFGGSKRQNFAHFKRAAEDLNIRVIFASSAQAKGRIERSHQTIQDRLIPEMRLRKIVKMPTANDFLQQHFLPGIWNQRFKITAHLPVNKYMPLHPSKNLNEILCVKEYRQVKADHTFSYNSAIYLIDSPIKRSLYGHKVEIREYQDLTWKVWFADQQLSVQKIDPLRRLINLSAKVA